MRKILRWVLIIGIGLIVLSALTGDEEESTTQPPDQPAKQEQTGEETSPDSSESSQSEQKKQTGSGVSTEEETKVSFNLDNKPISDLIPQENIHGLQWDYQDELMDFHLEKRKGADVGVVGHWSNPGDFSPGAMVRLFRYQSSDYARSSQKIVLLENANHHKETATVMGQKVEIHFGVFHNEDYSTVASANIEYVDGSTEIEIHATQTLEGVVNEAQLGEEWKNAQDDALAIFQAILGRSRKSDTDQPAKQEQTVEETGDRLSAKEKIEKQLQAERSTSIPQKDNLSNYIPENLEGFNRVESNSAGSTELDIWGAESGWLSFWEKPDLPFEVNFYDLTIDLYKFGSEENAKNAIVHEMQITGEVKVESIEGLPVMLVVEEYDYDTASGADAYLGYHQDNLVTLIHSMKEVTEGTVSSDQVLEEAKRAFKEMVKVANN